MPVRYTALCFLFLTTPALAQQLDFDDAFAVGGTGREVGVDVAGDADGNVFLVGLFPGADPSQTDVFLAKYAPDGVRLWARRMGAADADDVVEAVAVDRDGNAYVAGAFSGNATWQGGSRPDIALTSRGGLDGFLARYDAAGDLVWVEQVGGAGDDAARGVDVDPFPERQVLLAGGFEETATLGGGTTLTSVGGEDAFVARYTAEGELLWARRGGGPEDDGAWAVSAGEWNVPTKEGTYVVGTFGGLAGFGPF